MAQLNKLDLKGKEKGKVDVEDGIFKAAYKPYLLHDYVTMQSRAARAGTQSTKTRSEVSGTGKKPFKQKGTGRARQGSLKGPHQYGGGVAFAPKPRSYVSSMNRKTKKEAIRGALSQKNFESNLVVLESFEISSGKAKEAFTILQKISPTKTLLIGNFSPETVRSVRNLVGYQLLSPKGLNVYDILRFEKVLIVEEALPVVNEYLQTKEKVKAA